MWRAARSDIGEEVPSPRRIGGVMGRGRALLFDKMSVGNEAISTNDGSSRKFGFGKQLREFTPRRRVKFAMRFGGTNPFQIGGGTSPLFLWRLVYRIGREVDFQVAECAALAVDH